MTTEVARAPEETDPKKQEQLASLIELWNLQRQNWILQAISNCVLGEAEGYQKNVYRHLIKRALDPLRIDPAVQVESLLLLGAWKNGTATFPVELRRHKGRAWWTVNFPGFNLVGRGNRPRTILNKEWKTTRTRTKPKKKGT
jgi:hypothetical protein